MKKTFLICTLLIVGFTASTNASTVKPSKPDVIFLNLLQIKQLKLVAKPVKDIDLCTQYGFEVNQYGRVKVYEATAATCAEAWTILAIWML